MASRRTPYSFSNFAGENNVDSIVEQRVFGNRGRKLRQLRNYQTIGWGLEKKRYGYQSWITAAVNGAAIPNGVGVHKSGSTYQMVVVAGDKIKVMDKVNDQWIDITGAATPTAGKDNLWRFGRFTDGTNQWIMGTNGLDEPFLWDGNTANSVRLLSTFDASTLELPAIVGLEEFNGHVLLLNDAGLKYSAFGEMNFSSGGAGIIEGGQGSKGYALHRHSGKSALLFYEEEIYMLESNQIEGLTWRAVDLEDSEPCIARNSIVTKDGVTYYCGDRGIHSLKADGRPAKFIGREIETYFMELNQSRKAQISAVRRGQPWNELMWLVTHHEDSTEHNSLIVYNDALKAWNIFPASRTSGKMEFNCGVTLQGTDGIPRTIVMGYNGIAYEAFGHRFADSSFLDDGAQIYTTFETGFMDYGYAGISATRDLFLDLETPTAKTFTLTIECMGKTPIVKEFTAGAGGALLDVGFTLDESVLSESQVSQAKVKVDQDGKYTKFRLEESDTDTPHSIAGFNLPHLNRGMRMTG